eukprot:4781015-Prymnesium_polylepis.1
MTCVGFLCGSSFASPVEKNARSSVGHQNGRNTTRSYNLGRLRLRSTLFLVTINLKPLPCLVLIQRKLHGSPVTSSCELRRLASGRYGS